MSASTYNDALQLYNIGSSTTNNTNDGVTIPEGSETLSDLIKLNYNFKVEPNVPTPESYNIYIWNNNVDGEIRFHTLNAKNYNDYNQDYLSGAYNGLRLEHNTKIGKDGHLYYWHNYTITNPTKSSGWYQIDSSFNSVEIQQNLLEAGILANSISIGNIFLAIADINAIDTTQTGQITTLFTNIGIIETRLTALENDNLVDEFAGYSPVSVDYDAVAQASMQRREVERLITQEASIARQTALREVNTKYGSVISNYINSSVQSIGGLILLAGLYAAFRQISDNEKKTIYEDEIVAITNSLNILPVSLSNNTINHTRLSIVSGNTGFTLSDKEFIIPIQRNAVLKMGINSSLNAYIIVVDKPGDTYFTIGESITVNKNLINGAVGNLVINVDSLGTLKEWTELKNTYLINKINKINTKNRRKNFVIGHDDVNTEQFTNVDTTYTDYDEYGSETITYKVLKSRINLLPTGANDVDLYTTTGKVGIGTTPITKLHLFDNLTNETKLTIQNTSNILLQTAPSSSIDLIITSSNVLDYNVGNYNGNFKVISKNNGTSNEQMVINSTGFVGIGTDPSAVHKLTVNGAVFADRFIGFNVNIGKLSSIDLNVYKATNPTIRIESDEAGTPIIEFMRGTNSDINKDYRFISQSDIFKLQYQNDTTLYGADTNQLLWFDNTKTIIYKEIECKSNVGIGTDAATTDLLVYKNTNPIVRVQSLAEGTPIIEFTRGVLNDTNKDYRFVSQSDTLKLQYQDNYTSYGNNINQLIWANDTDMIIHKQTEFKANVLIGGDTRTIGYVGIGTTAATALHVYTAAANILRLQTASTNGTNSIEFVRNNTTDNLTDYRLFTDTTGKFKMQYANDTLGYGATDTDLIELSTTNTIIYKPIELKGNVGIGTTPHATHKLDILGNVNLTGNIGIGTTPHATYKVDVNGTINATSFRGSAADITDIPADKITTGTLNNARLTHTGTKIFEACEPTTFIVNPSDKLDIPPVYSFNITAYDRLANTTASYLEAGKFTCTYEDRNGTYKFIPTYIPNLNSKVILNYRVGDKITFKNTANTQFDYQETPQQRWARLSVFKMPSNIAWTSQGQEISYMLPVIDWDSDSPNVLDWTGVSVAVYPRQTPVTMQIQAGFKYFFVKWQRNNDANLYNSYITPATEASGMNIAYGGGQGFKISGDYSGSGGYKPISSMLPPLMTADTEGTARRGSRLSIDNGVLSADIPISSDLITNMNTSHFTNNTGTNKIEISSTYVAPSATKLATARNIAGTAFDGTENINITYGNLSSIPATWGESQIPSLPISKITNLQSTLDGKAPTSHTHAIADVTNLQSTLDGKAPTSHTHAIADVTNLQTTLDGKAPTSHTHTIANITNLQTTLDGKAPTSHSHVISDVTNLQTSLDGKAPTSHNHTIANITNLQTTLDGKAPTSHTHVIGDVTNLQTSLDAKQATLTSANTIGVFNTTQFVNNVGTSKIDIDVNWKPTTASIADSAMQLVSTRNIAGVGFNGTTSIGIPYFNLDFKPTAGTGITISAGSSTSSPVISATASTPTPATLITILNTNDFTSNVVTNKIDLSNNTSNYVASVNSTLTTAIGTKQNTINSVANQIIIGNGNGATTTNAGLTWTGGNTLNATNFSGNGANINNLNAGNFSSGFLAIARGGTGTDTILDQSILVGNGANPVATYTGLTYDFANRSLKSDRITGVIQYSATVTNITDASIYVSSTPTTTTAITKNIQTINGEYIISTSSTGASSIIENIFDNTTSSWTTATSSYVKQAGGTNTTGTNFPTTITTPSLTIYGEWIQVKFPRRTCVDDIRVLPFAGATYPNSIFRWTLLATNNVSGNSWIRVYTNTKTFLTSSEQSLLPALGNTNTIQYLYYRLVVEEILGVTGSATGSTLSLILLNVKFMVKDTIMYNDAIVCIGEPIATAPVANTILNVNGGVDIDGRLNTTQLRVSGTTELIPPIVAPTAVATMSVSPAPTSTFTPADTLFKCAILTWAGTGNNTEYTIVVPSGGLLCDILMVGGGGAGGQDIGAGGGGGAVLYATGVRIPQGTYSLFVGRGATQGVARGISTTGFGATLLGGGSAGQAVWANSAYANDGGSGAGGKSAGDEWTKRAGRPVVGGSIKGGLLINGILYEGSVGGYGVQQVGSVASPGGGGAGAVGGNGGTTSGAAGASPGIGGAGVSNTILDTNYFWGGGGGGGSYLYTAPNGGAGGGGAGQNNNGGGVTSTGSNGASSFFAVQTAINGINGTGGGGGGVGYTTQTSGIGGAGVIIIRYRQPINHNQTIDYLTTGTNGVLAVKQGMVGGQYAVQTTQGSIVRDRFKIDNSGGTSISDDNIVVKGGTSDTFINNNVGINIDPSSTYRLNVNGDININGNIWQNGFSVNAGFQGYRTFNFTYSGDTNFLLTTRARYCNIICWTNANSGRIVSNGANMAVGEFRGSLGFGGGILNSANNWFFYWTMQGDSPRPFKAWFGNGSNTTFTFLEMWYN